MVDAESDAIPERRGDTRAATRLRHMSRAEIDRAFRLAGLVLGSADDAEDATQEAFARAWRSAASLLDDTRFVPWFDRILVNVCRDRLRRSRRIRFMPLKEAEAVAAGDPFLRLQDRNQAVALMKVLSHDQRIVIVLHYWADLTLEAVAEHTGWRLGTVKSRLHSSLKLMRNELAGSGEE